MLEGLEEAQKDPSWSCSKVVAGCHALQTKKEANWSGYARRIKPNQLEGRGAGMSQLEEADLAQDHWTTAGSGGTGPPPPPPTPEQANPFIGGDNRPSG